jgi:hypothetical protein
MLFVTLCDDEFKIAIEQKSCYVFMLCVASESERSSLRWAKHRLFSGSPNQVHHNQLNSFHSVLPFGFIQPAPPPAPALRRSLAAPVRGSAALSTIV